MPEVRLVSVTYLGAKVRVTGLAWVAAGMPVGWRADLAPVQFQPPGGRLNGLVARASTNTAGCFE